MAEEQQVADEKKAKKPKKEKKEKPAKIKKEKPPKEKKGVSPIFMFLGMLLFFIILIAGAVVLIYFNVGNIKAPIDEFLNFSDFAVESNRSIINDEKAKLQTQETDLKKREEELTAGQKTLANKEKELGDKERDLQTRERSLATPTPGAAPGSPGVITPDTDLKIAISTLNEMDPETAARILEGLTNQEYLMKIIRSMNKDVRAAILEVMDVERARSIISALNTA